VSVRYLTVAEIIEIARDYLGSSFALRDPGLISAAAARPQTCVFGEEPYPDLWLKAAALLHSLVGNHALVDGNKRVALICTDVFLKLNGARLDPSRGDEIFKLVMSVADGSMDEVDQIAAILRSVVIAEP
jgi:death-on-curing protein